MDDEPQDLLQRALLGEAAEYLEGLAVFVWNEERRYVAVNREACRLVGLSREELIGMAVGGLTAGGAAEEVQRVRFGTVTDGQSTFTRRDGEVVPLKWTTTHTRLAGLPYMVSVCRRADS